MYPFCYPCVLVRRFSMVFLRVAVRGQKRYQLAPENVHLSPFGARSVHVHTTPLRCQRLLGVSVYRSRDAQWSRPPSRTDSNTEGSETELLLSPCALCGGLHQLLASMSPHPCPGLRRQLTRGLYHAFASHPNTHLYFRLWERAGDNVSFQDACVSLACISFYVLRARNRAR